MLAEINWGVAFGIVLLVSGIAVFAYFYGRKVNLIKMRDIALLLEKGFDVPEDDPRKKYVWLGYPVGYEAHYVLNRDGIKNVIATYVTLPRESLFYYPIAKLVTVKHDRLYMHVELQGRPDGTVHIVSPKYEAKFRKLFNVETMASKTLSVEGVEFKVFYTNEELLNKVVKALEKNLGKLASVIQHVYITHTPRSIYVYAKAVEEAIIPLATFVREVAREVSKIGG